MCRFQTPYLLENLVQSTPLVVNSLVVIFGCIDLFRGSRPRFFFVSIKINGYIEFITTVKTVVMNLFYSPGGKFATLVLIFRVRIVKCFETVPTWIILLDKLLPVTAQYGRLMYCSTSL